MMLACGATLGATRAIALEAASKPEDIWAEIEAGKFDVAAQRLQLHLNDWPLDHDAQTYLAVMQFADGDFARAAERFGRLARLRRGFATRGDRPADLQILEAWYRLARLRMGHQPDSPPIVTPNSLLILLNNPGQADAFVDRVTDAQVAYLDGLAQALGQIKPVTTDDGTATVSITVDRPDRATIRQTYRCLANFMLGEQALAHGKEEGARDYLSAAIATGAVNQVEYHIAKAELARIG